jgi:hypothetical protein
MVVLLASWLLVSGRMSAADAALPKADAVLDQYFEVTGGRAAYKKIQTQITTGSMEFVGKGVKAMLTSYKMAPNKSYSVMELESIGKIEQGTDGETVWEKSAVQGPRIKTGEERASALREAALNADWRELFKKAEMAGVEPVGGRECYKIVLTPNEGKPETRYYDTKTHLLVKVTKVVKTSMGEIPAEFSLGDYRDVGGILIPHRIAQTGLGQEFLVQLEKVQQNPQIAPSRFDLPEDVKALRNKGVSSK